MKTILKSAVGTVALVAALGVAGCASVVISSPDGLSGVDVLNSPTQADRQVVVHNTGFHMFWSITIGTGDLRWDAEKNDIKGGFAVFQDYCGNDDCFQVLQNIAKRENCDLVDVIFTESSTSGFNVSSYAGLFGGIAGMFDVQACGILRKRSERPEKEVK